MIHFLEGRLKNKSSVKETKKKRQKLAFIIRKHAHIYERLLCGMQKVFLELNKRKIKQPFKEKKGFKES